MALIIFPDPQHCLPIFSLTCPWYNREDFNQGGENGGEGIKF